MYADMAITTLSKEGEQAYNDGLAAELERLRIKNEKKQLSKEKKSAYLKEYQSKNKDKIREWAKNLYYTNDEYRQNKRLCQAYKRYLDGVSVSNQLVDEMIAAGYQGLKYRRPQKFNNNSTIVNFE